MTGFIHRWFAANRIILTNATAMVGTYAVTSALGFFYWWAAARLFPTEAVGFASASVSAMQLLGTIGLMGLGTLLVGELPRQPGRAGSLIVTSVLVAGTAAGGLGVLFSLTGSRLSAELSPLVEGPGSVALFALGVALTAAVLVIDPALIGLLRGGLQLRRNVLFAASKLAALLLAGLLLTTRKNGLVIYGTWVIGVLVSLADLGRRAALKQRQIASSVHPQLSLLRGLRQAALGHHALNLALEAPGLTLPVMVTMLISASANASFYVSWMLAGFAAIVSSALTLVLYAVSAAEPEVLAEKMRFTLKLSLISTGLMSGVLIIGATLVLRLFGSAYAEQAEWPLRILALGALLRIIRVHYVAVCRVYGQTARAARFMAISCLLQLVLAAAGARIGGLTGLSLGWLVAVCIEATITTPLVYRVVSSARSLDKHQAKVVSSPLLSLTTHYQAHPGINSIDDEARLPLTDVTPPS